MQYLEYTEITFMEYPILDAKIQTTENSEF